MDLLVFVYLLAVISVGHVTVSISPTCVYNSTTPSEYVTCFTRKQRPSYACDSDGGSLATDKYQIHILETDLSLFEEDEVPTVKVSVKKLPSFNSSKPIVLVFHSFRQVKWEVSNDIFPSEATFIIRSSFPVIFTNTGSILADNFKFLKTLPNDSQDTITTVESLYGQRVTSFSGFHEGNYLEWHIGTGSIKHVPCSIVRLTISARLIIWKTTQVRTSGCSVPIEGSSTHIIDLDKTQDTDFAFAKHQATVKVQSKASGQDYYSINVLLVLRGRTDVHWTIDTSDMDGEVMVITNGKVANRGIRPIEFAIPTDLERQEFIDYVSDTYPVSSYTHVDFANIVTIEVPEARMDPGPTGNTTEHMVDPFPSAEDLVASFDGQKTVNCYKKNVHIWWPTELMENLMVKEVSFSARESNCGLNKMGSEVALLSGYEQCGFKATKERYSTLYTAAINVTLTDNKMKQIDVQCRIYNTTGLESVSKSAIYQLDIFEDADFRSQITTSSVPYNGYVYFKADLNEITDPNMSAVVEECFLSPNKDNILDRHVLISRSCPLDGSIVFLNYANEKSQKIKFKMTQWFLNTNNYYLHCKMSMCSNIITPDISQCSSVGDICKRDPVSPLLPEGEDGLRLDDYLLAGPISVRNYTTSPADNATSTDVVKGCENGIPIEPSKNDSISVGLLIGISLGSFALGIILTVLTIHCVTLTRSKSSSPATTTPTDVYRLQNRQSNSLYESIKIYNEFNEICPQGRHLNRTSNPDLSSGI